MSSIRRAEVRFKDTRVGTLEQTADRSSRFTYDADWKTPIACALPLVPNIHAYADGLHPVFQHLTAEGWLRERQARAGVLDVEDDFGLLAKYGSDCIGAISVHGDGAAPAAPATAPANAGDAAVRSHRTISGVQKKLLLTKEGDRFVAAGPDGPALYIGKFNSDDIPTFVRNEALTLELARLLLGKAQVTGATQGHVETFGHALIVERFDRTRNGDKLRLEDLAQVLGRPRGPDNSYKYGASFEEAGAAIRQFSVRPEVDLLYFFKLVVANGLLGNCDAHLKNFSLLERKGGLRLAPAYDLVNTVAYFAQGYSTRFALRIDGRYWQHDELTEDVFRRLGGNLGLNARTIDLAFADLRKAVPAVSKRVVDGAWNEREPGFFTDYEQIVSSAIARILP